MKVAVWIIAVLIMATQGCATSIAETDAGKASQQWQLDTQAVRAKARAAKLFCADKKMNTQFAVLMNIGIHSGRKRLYVYDLKADSIAYAAVVSHGCGTADWGDDDTRDGPQISNTENSHCSSIGKYKIGNRGASQWGIGVNYILHGLESTNDNAVKRAIVLHSWDKIKDEEQFPRGTPEGWGCPAVSDNTMRYLDDKLKNAEKPVLLWVYQD